MLQYSVYARFFASMERAETFHKNLKIELPPDGQVRFLPVTDVQFGKMEVYEGKKRIETEKPPDQLLLL